MTNHKLFFGATALFSAYHLTRLGSLSRAGQMYAPIGLAVGAAGFFCASATASQPAKLAAEYDEKYGAKKTEEPKAE